MCERALAARAFGKHLADYANVQDWIAQSRIEIDQARLLVLRAAWMMDSDGNKAARVDVSAIKLVAAQLQTRVLDRAIQVFGAMGLTPDTPLSYLWTWGRALRFIDGPDEVHLRTIARAELARARDAARQHGGVLLQRLRASHGLSRPTRRRQRAALARRCRRPPPFQPPAGAERARRADDRGIPCGLRRDRCRSDGARAGHCRRGARLSRRRRRRGDGGGPRGHRPGPDSRCMAPSPC